jgi:hypothetical protein
MAAFANQPVAADHDIAHQRPVAAVDPAVDLAIDRQRSQFGGAIIKYDQIQAPTRQPGTAPVSASDPIAGTQGLPQE